MDLIDAYLKYTKGHESTDRIRKWSFISVLAGLLERRVWIDRGYYTLFPNLYVFIIGRSGLIKKSTSTGIAVNLLREIPGIKMMAERLTAGSLVTQLAASGKTFLHDGKKVKQSALFAYASELAVMLQDQRGPVTELLTTFYDCQPNDSEKPWTQNTVNGGMMQIFGPCLNILGASTKAWLSKCIPENEMEGGFTSRVIFVVENKLPDHLVAWPELSADERQMRAEIVEGMRRIHGFTGEITVTAGAKKFFAEWYENHMKNVLPKNMDPRMVGYIARKGDTILKLAMIKSVASYLQTIEKRHLEWAIAELDLLEPDWRGAFEGIGIKEGLAWDLRNYIRTRNHCSQKDLLAVFATQYPITEIDREIRDLISMGEISEVPMGPDNLHYAYVPD